MILAPASLGMLGGGQLGRFFVMAGHELGYKVTVLDPDAQSPAGLIADEHLVAAYDDPHAINYIAQTCAAVSTEFENVPSHVLDRLAQQLPVRPSGECVAIAQNRIHEKNFVLRCGLPCAPFALIQSEADLFHAPENLFPGILKVSRFGYDGKGQARVHSVQEACAAFAEFKSEPCVLEQRVPLDCEISIVIARGGEGDTVCFPVAENQHRHGILDMSIVPARIAESIRRQAEQMALLLAEKLNYVGVIGVEFFISQGQLLINEIAPRPHNSAHYTIDACFTNQFEQQVRVLCGLPLVQPMMHSAAVMVNLLGDLWNEHTPAWQDILQEPTLKLHLYGKQEARPGRKMGHFTVLNRDVARALEKAFAARQRIGIIETRDDATHTA